MMPVRLAVAPALVYAACVKLPPPPQHPAASPVTIAHGAWIVPVVFTLLGPGHDPRETREAVYVDLNRAALSDAHARGAF